MLTIPVLTTKCTTCRGRGVLLSSDGSVKKCPRCGGSGLMNLRVRRLKFDYSWPTFQFASAGATQSQELQLDDDAYFEHVAWSMAFLSNGAVVGPGIPSGVQITDMSTGWQFSNNPVAINNFASGGVRPSAAGIPTVVGSDYASPLVVPYIFKPTSQLQATITFPSFTSGTVLLQLTMKGYKVYPLDSQQLPEETMAA